MSTEIIAVVRLDGSEFQLGGAVPADDPNAGAHRIAEFPLEGSDGPAGVVSLYVADSIESLQSAGPNAVRSSADVIPVSEQCLRMLLADGVTGLLGAPPSTVWRQLDGPPPRFDGIPDQVNEPALEVPSGSSKKPAAGVVIVDESGCLTIVEPRNHFGGYSHTYPKGHARLDRETLQQAAHRELFEETGLQARILAVVGDFPGDTTVTRYYLGVLIGGEAASGDETAHVKTVGPLQALALLNRQRDKDVLRRVLEIAASEAEWEWTLGGEIWRCQLKEGRICRLELESRSAHEPEDLAPEGDGTGVWAAQFGSGQHRLWFRPRSPSTRDELYDRVAGILLRELGKDVMLSALWTYPDRTYAAEDGRRDGCAVMFHIVPRQRTLSDELVEAEYQRLSAAVVAALADRTADHWPPVDPTSG